MPFSITLTGEIAEELARRAEAQRTSIEQVVGDLLSNDVHPEPPLPTPEQVVARIVAMPPNPNALRPATDSLADALRRSPQDPAFNQAEWDRQWAAVEAEMKRTTRANDVAEGRR